MKLPTVLSKIIGLFYPSRKRQDDEITLITLVGSTTQGLTQLATTTEDFNIHVQPAVLETCSRSILTPKPLPDILVAHVASPGRREKVPMSAVYPPELRRAVEDVFEEADQNERPNILVAPPKIGTTPYPRSSPHSHSLSPLHPPPPNYPSPPSYTQSISQHAFPADYRILSDARRHYQPHRLHRPHHHFHCH